MSVRSRASSTLVNAASRRSVASLLVYISKHAAQQSGYSTLPLQTAISEGTKEALDVPSIQ